MDTCLDLPWLLSSAHLASLDSVNPASPSHLSCSLSALSSWSPLPTRLSPISSWSGTHTQKHSSLSCLLIKQVHIVPSWFFNYSHKGLLVLNTCKIPTLWCVKCCGVCAWSFTVFSNKAFFQAFKHLINCLHYMNICNDKD